MNLPKKTTEKTKEEKITDVKLILFSSDFKLHIIKADGSGLTSLNKNIMYRSCPIWLPDGKKIAYVSITGISFEIYVVSSDGSNETNLTKSSEYEYSPSWSPDSKKISFSSVSGDIGEIYVMNADGSGKINLTNNLAIDDRCPSWQP